MYTPLDVLGLALFRSATSASRLAAQARDFEAGFADGAMDDAGPVGAVLNLSRLGLPDGTRVIGGDGADLGVGHQPAGSQDLAERPDDPHRVRRGHRDVEVVASRPSPRPRGLQNPRYPRRPPARHPRPALARTPQPARSCRCRAAANRRSTHYLIRLSRVDAEIHRHVHRLHESGLARLLTRSSASSTP